MASAPQLVTLQTRKHDSREVVLRNRTNELVIAVVGHVGSGTSTTCNKLAALLADAGYDVGSVVKFEGTSDGFDHVVKASSVIQAWSERTNDSLPSKDRRDLERAQALQDFGDRMRKPGDHAAVARALIKEIRARRQARIGAGLAPGSPQPDGQRRAYILDSIRHPAEVELLRHLYQGAFALIGVVCDEEERLERLRKKFPHAGEAHARQFMERDRKAKEKHGQRVEDAFQLSDYFLDNSQPQTLKNGRKNKNWELEEKLSRFIKILTHQQVMRPEAAETAMYAAEGAKLRSACLSRQVGAALVDGNGNLMATGTNEVPRAGGGVYGQRFSDKDEKDADGRCAYRDLPGVEERFCSNTREQAEIQREVLGALHTFLEEILKKAPGIEAINVARLLGDDDNRKKLEGTLRDTRLGGLLEFSRAVHAEMDALLSAARQGLSPAGARLFVTTFPCHVCARHIVAAGVDEVQYIEPYPKSLAFKLHQDAITGDVAEDDSAPWERPSKGSGGKVLFRHFTGVAPRLYARAFLKDRELKDKDTGVMRIGAPDWGTPWDIGRQSYLQLEEALAEEV